MRGLLKPYPGLERTERRCYGLSRRASGRQQTPDDSHHQREHNSLRQEYRCDLKREGKIPLYAHETAATSLESIFRYIFKSDYKFGGIARVEMNRFNESLDLFGARFDPVQIIHGEAIIHGFRFGSAAYLTDFSEIPPESKEKLRDLDILFLDALRHRPHPTHSTVENSLRLVEELKPRRAFFTHISHDLPHRETNMNLPEHVRLAHDGLKLEFEIA